MEIYYVRKKNLPLKVLVLKEISRRILSAKQYQWFRKHIIVFDPKIARAYYHPSSWKYGSRAVVFGRYCHVTDNTGNFYKSGIETHIHEISHMCQHHNKSIKLGSIHHNKTFHRLAGRLLKNYREEVEPQLQQIIEECKQREAKFLSTKTNHEVKATRHKLEKNTPAFKLIQTQKAIKRWNTKLKRAQTQLKKLSRREKLYTRLSSQISNPPPDNQTPDSDTLQQ